MAENAINSTGLRHIWDKILAKLSLKSTPIELTTAQYNALPSSDKNDASKVYYLTDYPSGGGSGSGFGVDVLFDGSGATSLQSSITLTAPWSSYDAIAVVVIEYYNNREYRHTNGVILKEVLQASLDSLSTNGGWIDIAVQNNSIYAFAEVESTTELVNIYGTSTINHIDKIYGVKFG